VTKVYLKGVVALRGFSLELKPGVLGRLGPNGAGKTTLMSILSTITKATEGRVLWNGTDVARELDVLGSALGYLPQDFGGARVGHPSTRHNREGAPSFP
jgi:ABC-type multidrug transport system ATPase subunit